MAHVSPHMVLLLGDEHTYAYMLVRQIINTSSPKQVVVSEKVPFPD